jgi:hypothetical protein
MSQSWSNRKVTEYTSPVERAKNRPSSASALAIALTVFVVAFFVMMFWILARVERHPPTEIRSHSQSLPKHA